jgi:hypothetical protein
MKVRQLFEGWADHFQPDDTVPSEKDTKWSGRYKETEPGGDGFEPYEYEDLKYKARILLAMDPPISTKGLDQSAVKDAYERAKAKFMELRKAHPTQLRFKNTEDAEKYMKTMEYPGWTLIVQWARLDYARKNNQAQYTYTQDLYYKKTRKVKALDLKKQEFKPKNEASAINVEMDGDKVKLSIDTKVGPLMSLFIETIYYIARKTKFKYVNVKGVEPDIYRSRPQKIWFKTSDIETIKGLISKKREKNREMEKDDHERLQNALADRKTANKASAELQKQRKEELYKRYGKEIVDRVKIKPMSHEGDDGYQWALFVDGRRKKSGLTQYRAQGEQRMMWDWLLKWSKMTPEEQLDHISAVRGMEAYFAYQAMERSVDSQLPQYLDAIKKNAKKFVDAKQATKDAIETSKVSDAQAKKIFNDLMNKLGDKSSD